MGSNRRARNLEDKICDLQMNLNMSRDCTAELRVEVERLKATTEERRNMLEDVVNELDLSDGMIDEHGPLGTAPATLVRLVLERKDREIAILKAGMVPIAT